MCEMIRQEWIEAITNINRKKANQIIDEWINDHGSEHVFEDILRPALDQLVIVK